MTSKNWLISRRTALKGLGVALGLPLLETMGWAETPKAGGAYKPPVRFCAIYVPHGVHNDHWWPEEGKAGANASLPSILEPLRPVIGDTLILGGLHHAMMDGDGDAHHARETAVWLTGFPSKRETIENNISIDQVMAQKIGAYTVLPSLELGLQESRTAGNCDKGYSCAYHGHISWRSPTQPCPKERAPRAVFERMFQSRKGKPTKKGSGPAVDAAAFGANAAGQEGPSLDQSMLDLVLQHAKSLRGKVSGNDQRKLDEYLDGTRELEKRIQAIERQAVEQAAAKESKKGFKQSPLIEVNTPGSIPEKFSEHARLMLDLITLGFQSDTTRIATLMFSQAFGRSYPECGVPENHHECSHHGKDPQKLERIRKINTFHVEQLSYFLQRLKSLNEGKGSLLDNCLVLYGSGMGDGDRHDHKNLPTLLCGKGGGTVTQGRYVKQVKGNFSDLLMGISARMGCPVEKFGDGTKLLPDLV